MHEAPINNALEIPEGYFLESERLILKPIFKFDNNAEIAKAANNRELADHMGFAFPYDYKETDAKAFKDLAKIKWSEQSEFHLGIQTMEGNFVGVVGIQIDKNGKCTNFGYWLGEEFWGKGYATEAVNAALAFSFNKLKLYKVEAVAHSNNPASQKVLEKTGFKNEGMRRQSYKRRDGELFDNILYGMTIEDYDARS